MYHHLYRRYTAQSSFYHIYLYKGLGVCFQLTFKYLFLLRLIGWLSYLAGILWSLPKGKEFILTELTFIYRNTVLKDL